MRLLVATLLCIARISMRFPRVVIAVFLVLSVAGYSSIPFITVSSNLIAGVGETNPIINRTIQNNDIFGEQDALIVVLEFPEPPGESRLPFIKGISEAIGELPGVRRIRYRFLDPDDPEMLFFLLKQFILGMNRKEREEITHIFTPEGVRDAFRRNVNRLFLTENPYLGKRILEDPMELGLFVSQSMRSRVGALSLGDVYLLLASPDSTEYLIQVTPDFPSADIVRGKDLVKRIEETIPAKLTSLENSLPGSNEYLKGVKWYLTGKVVFHRDSDVIFDRESAVILIFAFTAVSVLLIVVYRSLWAGLILITPIAAGIGPTYGLTYLSYADINPVVVGATGVLVGLGTDYGVHLWGKFREVVDQGVSPIDAIMAVYEETGPPVLIGGLTSILAFLCLCLSDQPAMAQFGYVGASGLLLTVIATLFLFPIQAKMLASRGKEYYPRMRVTFKAFSGLFQRHPRLIVALSTFVIMGSLIFAVRVSYEEDLFKVFLARDMKSMAVAERISEKFHSNFSQPTLLSFDVDDLQTGLRIQRNLDEALERRMATEGQIASFDSISYLMSPQDVRTANIEAMSGIVKKWPQLKEVFQRELSGSVLSSSAKKRMESSFDATGKILNEVAGFHAGNASDDLIHEERTWYLATVQGKHRFLTRVRYSENVTDPNELKEADKRLETMVKSFPVHVDVSGPRQVMEQVLASLVSELFKLGSYVFLSVLILFFLIFRHPLGVALSLIPMAGAFCMTLGVTDLLGLGLPFSIVGVAPLIFGIGMDNGVHVVMGSLGEDQGSVSATMERVTRPIIFTTLTNLMGFVSMTTSRHYSLEFLGWAMVIGMGAALTLTLTTLPALLLLLERSRNRRREAAKPGLSSGQ